MLELCLLRHADAAWVQGGECDFERSLSEKGDKEVLLMGRYLADRGLTPDSVVCSPAQRVIQTVDRLTPLLGLAADEVNFRDDIYEASVTRLLTVIRSTSPAVSCLLLVGHNPGISELIGHLSGRPVPHMPTCSFACLQSEVSDWLSFGSGMAELTGFHTPGQLSG